VRVVFFSFYYPPDLCAGSFRAISLARALGAKIGHEDELHIITTHPNRYATHRVEAEDLEVNGKITVHRIPVPDHQDGMVSQMVTFGVFALTAFKLCKELKPDFLVSTSGRLMTGVLTGISARWLRCNYFIDLRDIFSETISDLLSRKSRLLGAVTKIVFSMVEKRLLSGAAGVNVVSEAFPGYFKVQGIDTSNWSFFPNGVDQEFICTTVDLPTAEDNVKTILYAGNIGSGQGLETIIPTVARRLRGNYRFLVVGDGGAISVLRDTIEREEVDNVYLFPPVGRAELIIYYQKADILFLHLNDVPAFRRVLPSKIFEYAALGKPIVAGLDGYSAQFLRDHVPYACLFDSGDAEGAISAILKASDTVISKNYVDQFVDLYSRESIMDQMAEHLLGVMGSHR